MKFSLKMPPGLRQYYHAEFKQAKILFQQKQFQKAWFHLERAHIFGQPFALEHTAVHWKMLCFGWRLKNRKEIIGQLPRLIFGGVKSFVGVIPAGNPGGSDVPALKSFPLPEDIRQIFKSFQIHTR